MSAARSHPLRRGIYLLPSLFTIGNMTLGFYALVSGFRGSQLLGTDGASPFFQYAAVAVFVAAIVDTLDGRVARMTGTDSDFGREFDSLADLFTFGVTPALLAFFWGLSQHGRLGWLVPVFYMICTAIRLARFNVQTKVTDSRFFVGLPSPAAAGVVCSLLFFAPNQEWRPWLTAAVFATLLVIGGLEVSTFRYWSFKKLDLRRRWSYRLALPLAAVSLTVAVEPAAVFLVVGLIYASSGPISWLLGRFRRPGDSPPRAVEGEIR